MSDFDEISHRLGKIQGAVENTALWIEKYEKLDRERSDKIFHRLEEIGDLHSRIREVEDVILPIKAYIELAKVREYKIAGALVVIGGMVSIVGTILFAVWRNVTAYFGS